MKSVLRVLGLLFAILFMLPVARAADLTGKWKGAFEFNGDSVPLTLNLTISGDTVTGNVEGLPTTPTDIHDGKVNGETVSFWVNSDYQGQTYKLLYQGKISTDKIDFSFGTEDGSWGTTLIVKKDEAITPLPTPTDVSGDWKGAWDFNGTNMPVTFHLKIAGGVLTGTVEGMGHAPSEIHEGKVDGDAVTFWINTEYQGQTYVLNYKGKATADQISFDFGTADGGWGAAVTVKKGS